MTEEFGEVIKAIHKKEPKENIREELGDLLAWILCIANILDIPIVESVKGTFVKEIGRQLKNYNKMKYTDKLENLSIVTLE